MRLCRKVSAQGPFIFMNTAALIADAISVDRFQTYLDARAQDATRAFALYEWNARVCASLYVPMQILEVALRNAFHRELSTTFSVDWPTLQSFRGIDLGMHKKIDQAESLVRSGKRTVTVPRTVAALSFGTWTTMLSNHLEHSLWVPALCRAFPNYIVLRGRAITRPIAAQQFNELRRFRNRVAHHEPIFSRALAQELSRLEETAAWFSADVQMWLIAEVSACRSLVNAGAPT